MEEDTEETLPLLDLFSEQTFTNKIEAVSIPIEDEIKRDNTDGTPHTKKKKDKKNNKTIRSPSKTITKNDPKRTEVHHAAEVGDEEKLLELMKGNPNSLGKQDETGQTPLHLAAKGIHLRCCQILLEQSTKEVNIKDKNGFTPLLLSIQPGATSFQITNLLFSKSADLSKTNNSRKTALHIASEKGNIDTVKLLLKNSEEAINAKDSEQSSPLHIAAKKGHVSICAELLKANGNKNTEEKDSHGYTALHWAAKMGNSKTIEELLRMKCEVNCTDKNGNTPLHLFCLSIKDRLQYRDNKSQCVNMLLKCGANPNYRNKDGKIPFHIALISSYEVLDSFKGYPVDLELKDNNGKTSLHYAAKRKESKQVSFIMSMEEMNNIADIEAFINAKDIGNNTALHIAVKAGALDSCRILIKNGADVYATCNSKNTALHLAVEMNFTDICGFLIAKGIKVDIKNSHLQTPLHIAAKYGQNECCQVLLKQRADCTIVDANGNTALHYAAEGNSEKSKENSYISCCKTIMKAWPSSVKTFNKLNKTPLHIAVEKKSLKCCKALVDEEIELWSFFEGEVQTPIKLAYDIASYDIFQYLLQKCYESTGSNSTIDIDFQHLMKDSLENNNLEVIEAILSSCYWAEALQLRDAPATEDIPVQNDVLKHLIEKFPSQAGKVFDRCLLQEEAGTHGENKDRDFGKEYSKEKTKGKDLLEKTFYPHNIKILNQVETLPIDHFWRTENALALVVRSEHSNLLTHPLVETWVQYKWKSYVQYGYYSAMLWAVIHAVLLTTFSVIAWDWRNMYDKYQLNQSSVCSFETPLVGPEVVIFLKGTARGPNGISYAIYAMLACWILHHVYKSIKLRTLRMESLFLLLCVLTDILFLVNFSKCSQVTYVREDWQWVVGPFAMTFAWISVYYQFTRHVKHTPLLSSFKRYFTAAKDIIVPFIPVVIIWVLLYRIIPKGSRTLNEGMGWFFQAIQEPPSYITLLLILVVSVILLAQVRQGQLDYKSHYNEKRAIKAINQILDFDVLYPFIRKYYYNVWNPKISKISNNCFGTIFKTSVQKQTVTDDTDRVL